MPRSVPAPSVEIATTTGERFHDRSELKRAEAGLSMTLTGTPALERLEECSASAGRRNRQWRVRHLEKHPHATPGRGERASRVHARAHGRGGSRKRSLSDGPRRVDVNFPRRRPPASSAFSAASLPPGDNGPFAVQGPEERQPSRVRSRAEAFGPAHSAARGEAAFMIPLISAAAGAAIGAGAEPLRPPLRRYGNRRGRPQ